MNSIRRPSDLTRRFRIVALALILGGLILPALPAGAQLALTTARSHGRFTQSFTLDNGAMKVRPAPKSMKPARTESEAATVIWATSGVASTQRRFVGFGLAAITIRVKGVRVVKNLPSWIGVTYSNEVESCTAMTGPRKKLAPPHSDGYAAAADVCDKYRPASVQDALEMWSVPWTYSRPGVVAAHYPGCGTQLPRDSLQRADSPLPSSSPKRKIPLKCQAVTVSPRISSWMIRAKLPELRSLLITTPPGLDNK